MNGPPYPFWPVVALRFASGWFGGAAPLSLFGGWGIWPTIGLVAASAACYATAQNHQRWLERNN